MGDFPVAAVEAKLVAVIGLATAAVPIAVPAELAAAVPELPKAAKGAIQPGSKRRDKVRSGPVKSPAPLKS